MRAPMILIVLALFPLASCASITRPLLYPTPPASLTQPCPPLVRLKEPATLGSYHATVVENYGIHADCRARHKALAEWGR